VVRRYRRAAGLSQRELAERSGISLAAVRDLEQDRTRSPHPSTVRALVDALDLSDGAAEALRELAIETAPPAAAAPPAVEPPVGEVRIGVLGPLAVSRGGAEIRLARGRQRALLARLALSANSTVALADLVEVVWAGHPPAGSTRLVRAYVSRLRAALESGPQPCGGQPLLTFAPGGLRLNLDADQLDAGEFRSRVAAGSLDGLDAALRLWRGDPLEDVPELSHHPLVAALCDERIAATLRYAVLAGESDRAERALPWLRELASRQPLHEAVHAQLVLTLAASGRQAEALDAYQAIRRRLADELGIDPGAALVQAQQRVLRRSPDAVPSAPGRPVPAQLPADLGQFTGRTAELGRLDALLDVDTTAPVAAVSGTPGVGKTVLAVHWAHRVRQRFPDGQLYVNLRGFDPVAPPVPADEALRGFLDAFGVTADRMPATPTECAGLYRSLLAGRRVLVVLDNARDADHVRPLLPGTPGCVAVVTSRDALVGLVGAEGAEPVRLEPFTGDAAAAFLRRRLGMERSTVDAQAVADIAARCAGLPLALAVVAARAATNPDLPLDAVAEELDARRGLEPLSGGDPKLDVRAAFDCSYRGISGPAAELFRLLALHPGVDVALHAAARLAGVPVERVRPALAELVRASLLTELVPGRFTFHDLLRAYAAECLRAAGGDGARAAAWHRLLNWYLAAVTGADERIARRAAIRGLPADPGVESSLAVLDGERHNFAAVVAQAVREGDDGAAWQLAYALGGYFQLRGDGPDSLAVYEHGLTAALRCGDHAAQAALHNSAGIALGVARRFTEAIEHLSKAYALLGDDPGRQAAILVNVAHVQTDQARWADALRSYERSLELTVASGDDQRIPALLNNLGYVYVNLGEPDRALEYLDRALALQRDRGDRGGEANTLDSTGLVHLARGDLARAETYFRAALEALRDAETSVAEAATLANLGETRLRLGDPLGAAAHFTAAADRYRALGDTYGEAAVRERLARIG
jgi:DNA-binding SARP family transcriptional activator/tetratricopeptide (TPR) repeat protein